MKVLFLSIFSLTFLAFSHAALVPHPFGHAIQIQKYERSDDHVSYEVDYDKLYEFLGHEEIKDRKIVAFSIIGAYRRGKSFFLDYCLRYLYANYKSINSQSTWKGPQPNWIGAPTEPLSGFSWRSGMAADTQGILFWSDIFLYDAPNGDKIAIIIMDTQGLFEPGVSADFNSRIFGLSTLISSMQVINLNGVIQEDQLQYLEMSVEFTKLANKNQKSQLKPFQDLIFLIRDWADEDTGLGYEGGEIVYNEVFVKSVSNNPAAESVRKNINKAFDKISTFLLPFPGRIVTRKNFNGAYEKLDEEFTEYLKILIESIFAPEKLIPKKVFGKVVTGDEFKNLIALYFNEFNSGNLPKVESIFEATAKREMEKIAFALHLEYVKQFNNKLYFSEEDFLERLADRHKILKDRAVEEFRATPKMGSEYLENQAIEQMLSLIEESHKQSYQRILTEYKLYLEHKRIESIAAQLAEELTAAQSMQQQYLELQKKLLEQQQKKKKWYRRIFV